MGLASRSKLSSSRLDRDLASALSPDRPHEVAHLSLARARRGRRRSDRASGWVANPLPRLPRRPPRFTFMLRPTHDSLELLGCVFSFSTQVACRATAGWSASAPGALGEAAGVPNRHRGVIVAPAEWASQPESPAFEAGRRPSTISVPSAPRLSTSPALSFAFLLADGVDRRFSPSSRGGCPKR